MEPPGAIPPDRDKLSIVHHQRNINFNLATATSATAATTAGAISANAQHPNTSVLGSTSTAATTSAAGQQGLERLSRPMAFDKMEVLVREMQDPENGVPVRQQKTFLTSIPYAFMGYDLIEWLMDRLGIEESEALSIANQLCLHGYFFPVNDSKTLVVKDDSSLYRFQTPYYWPWQHKAPDNVEYAIYLAKRSLRNKQRHGLEDYESDALASLHKNLKGKWDFISMQAEEQVRLAKERKKGDKIVGDSQERAYWRVHRTPPGLFTPLEPCPVPSRDRQGIKPKKRTVDDWQREVDFLKKSLCRTRMKMSQACESLIQYWETFADYDFFLQPVLPSNPWVSEDTAFWQLNNAIVDIPTEKRVKRWAISVEELVSDPTGLQEFTTFLEKEYSHENIRFWIAVNRLRRSAHSQVAKKVQEIYEEFLKPGAPCEINIDGKTMEVVQKGLKNPSRFTFDAAAEHIYMLLLKKDCYPRFIRSEHYKALLASGIQPAHKKRFFGFGGVAKKKSSSAAAPNPALLAQSSGVGGGISQHGTLGRRRGSDRSLTGSAHELAIVGVKDASNKVPHSHSQSNLSEISYSVTVYRGDMPTESALVVAVGVKDSSTADGSHDACSMKTTQEGSKSVSERLESTAEVGACAVCPWETPEPAAETSLALSVCPWEDDSPAPPSEKPRIISSSSEITEVSERLRRSCGIRQNTLDSDFHSSKRLLPQLPEQRRASMTIAPRLSDLQFPSQRQSIACAATTPSPAGFPNSTAAAVYSDDPISTIPSNFETPDESSLLKTLTISEECSETTTTSNAENDEKIRDNNPITIDDENSVIETYYSTILSTASNKNDDDQQTVVDDQSKTINIQKAVTPNDETSEVNNEVLLMSKTKNNESVLSLNIGNISCEKLSSSTISQGTTPTINVVCPAGEAQDYPESQQEQEQQMQLQLKFEEVDTQKYSEESPTEAQVQIADEEKPPLSRKHSLNIDCQPGLTHADLSPTTEEYQECAQFGDQADYEYDIEADSAPGCVAPAPTPAPSLAPLAEIETDPADDEMEIAQCSSEMRHETSAEHAKRRRKKRDSDAKKCDEKTEQSKEDDKTRNAVCPWEDEDGSTSDATFVKTYATLGYL